MEYFILEGDNIWWMDGWFKLTSTYKENRHFVHVKNGPTYREHRHTYLLCMWKTRALNVYGVRVFICHHQGQYQWCLNSSRSSLPFSSLPFSPAAQAPGPGTTQSQIEKSYLHTSEVGLTKVWDNNRIVRVWTA